MTSAPTRNWTMTPGAGLPGLALSDVPRPTPGPGEVRVALRAASVNARDVQMAEGRYRVTPPAPLVPLSDGAGEITALGPGVDRFAIGDRVFTNAVSEHLYGRIQPSMWSGMIGVLVDGVLRDEFIVKANGLLPVPVAYSYQQAACIPVAGVTAWNAVMAGGAARPGDWVLIIGTGGVSMWALSIARAAGARVIITSRSGAKLDIARRLGADHTIDTSAIPDWDDAVRDIVGDGVDLVIENGGPETYQRSVRATRMFGTVSVVAVAGEAHPDSRLAVLDAMTRMVSLVPIAVGPREMAERLLRTIEANGITPVIGAEIPFDDAAEAYRLVRDGGTHIGKVVITV